MTSVFGGGLTRAQAASLVSPGARSGQVYGPPVFAAPGGTTCAADTIYAHPVFVPEAVPYAGLQIVVQTAVACLGKMALYGSAPAGLMGGLIEECPGTIDMNSVANTVLQANFAASRVLSAGWYWFACKFNGAAVPYGFAGGLMAGGMVTLYGGAGLSPFVRAPAASAITTRATVADAYANAFPAAPVLTFGTNTPTNPIMGIVAA